MRRRDIATPYIGAANYDSRSFRLNYEVCEVLYDPAFAQENTRLFERNLELSSAVSSAELEARIHFLRTL